ncbi:type VII secretion protein EccB [Micromonospora craniellae]|uniref:Type VII secretion protein EccB n=1 Tax=Micromonospora craniellae TaxID=2294034 RepID=A0A372FXQ1_9ACTN|nr:type VII secretion protein EccB [Micromonospora craniellae]RFS45565.1 type VII secretion protein EccB [Micromonospora craniellae]
MPSRRDQVEAYSFASGRLRSALVSGDPDAPRAPLRRTPIGLVIGTLLALLALGGAALLALLRPGSAPGWAQPGTLIIEKETGNRFVMADGRLHPVLNYSSARLLLTDKYRTTAVSAEALADRPRGGRLGIEGAPDLLPARSGGHSWLVCATGTTSADGQVTPGVTVHLDPPSAPDRSAAATALVRAPDGATYLVQEGLRLRLTTGWVAHALGYAALRPVPVTESWLETIPVGPDLGPIPATGRGQDGPGGTTVGQILRSNQPAPPDQFFLTTSAGLVPVNDTVAALVLGDPQVRTAYGDTTVGAVPVDLSTLSRVPVLEVPDWARLPLISRTPADWTGQVPCLRLDVDGNTVHSALVPLPQEQAQAPPIREPGTVAGPHVAGGFLTPPRGGALVRTLPAPGAAGIGLYLVVETGAKYPLANDGAATALGFSPGGAAPVPAPLLALLPTGPELRVLGGES